jgi:murein DD-endopeptidase MepM/ murein hydrolase activator NlpD
MSQFDRSVITRGAARLMFAGLASALLAGCSSDVGRFADMGSSPFQSSARVDQSSSYGGGSQQMASAAPISSVQSSPLSAPIQSAPLSAPVRAAAIQPASRPVIAHSAPISAPPMSAPKVIGAAPVRATAQSHMSPNIAAAKAVIEQHPTKTVAVAAPKPAVTTIAKTEPVKQTPVAEAPAAKPVRTASLETSRTTKSDAAPVSTAVATEEASPEFRWPARGRIIQGFKAGKSEGISIAVPEGTAVKAAEGGTVAYAGSELKGYGNLVLIRHPNGFVSAYAHNGELMVKRGDTVKRGQVVAKSGQSGDVSSPQLQFQLRKGSNPVDPTQYLAGL